MIALSCIWEYPGVGIKYDFDLLNWQEDELPDSAEGPDTLLGTYGTWALASKLHEKALYLAAPGAQRKDLDLATWECPNHLRPLNGIPNSVPELGPRTRPTKPGEKLHKRPWQ